jgi:anti-sigma-K factor RskA
LRHERATEEIREIAALYALGSLTQHEAQSFEVHMHEGCSICEAEFRKFEHVVAGIGLSSEEVAVPDYVRDLLLARVERESRAATPVAAQIKNSEPAAQPQKRPAASRPPIFSAPAQKRSNVFPIVLAAFFALIALLAYYALKTEKEANVQLRAKVSAANADSDTLRILLDVQRGRAKELEQIFTIAGKPESRVVRLAGQESAPAASGAILWDAPEGKFVALGFLPPEPEGKKFQLWFITPTIKSPAGFLKPDPTGRFFLSEPIPRNAADATAAVVTLEPDNGSQIPTTPFCAVARIQ